jgi:hypothetical protein
MKPMKMNDLRGKRQRRMVSIGRRCVKADTLSISSRSLAKAVLSSSCLRSRSRDFINPTVSNIDDAAEGSEHVATRYSLQSVVQLLQNVAHFCIVAKGDALSRNVS